MLIEITCLSFKAVSSRTLQSFKNFMVACIPCRQCNTVKKKHADLINN